MSTKLCLTLTAPTIRQNLEIVERYRKFIDIAELRADYLDPSEYPYIRVFPEMAGLPCILTVRRQTDGGNFAGGESARTVLFARGLAFADTDPRKNFSYVDLEQDFQISSIEEVVRGFGIKIIRSLHNMDGVETNLAATIRQLRRGKDEIAKIAFMAKHLSDVTRLFREAKACRDEEYTLIAMGPFGLPSRILAPLLGSCIAYCSVPDNDPTLTGMRRPNVIGQIDPVTLNEIYNFRMLEPDTEIFGITGYPMEATSSPEIHNRGYAAHKRNAVYIPVRSETIEEALEFAGELGIRGLSVTHPFKEKVLPELAEISAETAEIGACNTILRRSDGWAGYNTDISGFTRAILEFTGEKDLRHKNVAIIGAGGAAKAIALAVRRLRGKACVFNRTEKKAKELAHLHHFKWAPLERASLPLLKKYSDLIIQTTNVGMTPDTGKDPLDFYSFSGHEAVYDIIYAPWKTKLLQRAEAAGCRICNGFTMLRDQAYDQYQLFTGEPYDREPGRREKAGGVLRN